MDVEKTGNFAQNKMVWVNIKLSENKLDTDC